VKFIKLGGLKWAGHVMRMEEGEPVKESFLPTKPGGSLHGWVQKFVN